MKFSVIPRNQVININSSASLLPSSFSMPSRRLADVEESLRKAVESRGTTYVNREALVFCYEDDDTHAYKDAYAQKACLEDTFGINTSLLRISKMISSRP